MLSIGLVISYLLIAVVFLPLLLCGSSPMVLRLERAVSPTANLSHLVQRDRARHGRLLKSSHDGVINYTLGGTGDLSVGLYYTRLELGTPPSSYYVQVDTGSDVTWVGCVPCTYCPTTTRIPNISLHPYNPVLSTTFSPLSCFEDRCPNGIRVPGSGCSADNPHCRYWVDYGDHSHVSGFYVQEVITYDRNVGNSQAVRSTAPFVFGCATVESGFSTSGATDGILGLGQLGVSFISQLADQGLSSKVFAHCLRGDGDGGGILVLGEIAEPDIVYSPLIPAQPHYNLDLQGISVNGQILPIDPHMLSSPAERGVLIDSGTTLTYLQIGALTQVISAINASTSAHSMPSLITRSCYLLTSSVEDAFPQLSLHFAGGADLVLGPLDYLLYEGLVDGAQMWCTGFRVAFGPTIVGDLFMKNRLFVYDLAGQRIGWKNHDCSAPVNISINPKHGKRSNAARSSTPLQLVFWFLLALSLYQILLIIA